MPVGWQATRSWSGKPRTWFTAKVTRYEINVPIPRTEFQLVFPAGTWVNDRVTKCDYLVRAPNHRRIITKEEMDACATYAEVSKTESGRAVPAEYKVLLGQAFQIAEATSEERQQFIEAVKAKAIAAGHSGWPPQRCSLLVRVAAQRLDAAGHTELAIQLCHSYAQLLPDCGRELVAMANRLNAAARRNAPLP